MRLLALSSLLAVTSAMACPDLAGTYKNCRSTTGQGLSYHDVVMAQTVDKGITTYILNMINDEDNAASEDVMVTDGQARSQTDETDMGKLEMTSTSSCEGDMLHNMASMTLDGEEVAEVMTMFSKENGTMTYKITGQVFGLPAEDTIICE
jgi:uncharacterized protein YcgI (DUF1989 family)